MSEVVLNLPAMYGDHHIIEVRRILLQMPGVEDVFASSSFKVVQVHFDSGLIDSETIRTTLEDAGYTEELTIPVETGMPTKQDSMKSEFFRHTTAYKSVSSTVGFARNVAYSGRPLWPCPGMGVVKIDTLEDDVGDG